MLTQVTEPNANRVNYIYDKTGNITSQTATIGGTGYTTTYEYDPVENFYKIFFGSSWGRFIHDENGNLIDDGSKKYEYDYNNRLITVRNKSDNSVIATYTYDADGRRTSKTVGTTVTKYYYDGNSTRVLCETDGSDTLQVRYIYGADGQLVSMIRGASTYFYHYNGHGDVVALTDSSGTVVAEYDYDAWGNPVTTGREGSVVNPYRYAAYRYDSETGLYYLNARYYKEDVGRFITRDKFSGFEEKPASLNQYTYSEDDPVNKVDPEGMWAKRLPRYKVSSLLIWVKQRLADDEHNMNYWGALSLTVIASVVAVPNYLMYSAKVSGWNKILPVLEYYLYDVQVSSLGFSYDPNKPLFVVIGAKSVDLRKNSNVSLQFSNKVKSM